MANWLERDDKGNLEVKSGKVVLIGNTILDILNKEYPSVKDLPLPFRYRFIELVNLALVQAYEAGEEDTLKAAQRLAARNKILDDKQKEPKD